MLRIGWGDILAACDKILYGISLLGDIARQFIAVVTWGTALMEMICLFGTRENPDRQLVKFTFGPKDVHDAQVHIKSADGCVSSEAASRLVHPRGATVILRNDATGNLAAFLRGSANFPALQALAVRIEI